MSLRKFLEKLPAELERIIWDYLQEKEDYDKVIIEFSYFLDEFYSRFWHINPHKRFLLRPFFRSLKRSLLISTYEFSQLNS